MVTRIVILGGGPAGYEAALVAATSHPETTQVTVIDCDGIGGAAVLDDCVPSKTFIASTGLRTELRRAPHLGFHIDFDDAKISLPQIHARVKTLAAAQSADITAQLLSMGVQVIAGRGELIDSTPGLARHRIKATAADGSTSEHEADVVLVATGASPRILPSAQPDGERILTWRQLYDLDALPDHLIVVGSGVTGAEFVDAYTELGVPVTVVASQDHVLPYEDADAALVLEESFAERGVRLFKNARAASVTRTGAGVLVTMTDGRTVEGSHALMTIGSVPNTSGLGLERVGIQLGRGNYLTVDRVSRTLATGIYAAGDCTGLLPLASVAAMQGRIAMYHALGEGVSPIDPVTHGGRDGFHQARDRRGRGAAIGHRRRFGGRPDHHAAVTNQRARQDVGDASRVRQDLLPAVHRRCDRRRGGGADRIGADPAHRRSRSEPHHRQRAGPDTGRLPIVVGFDNRGGPPADGARRSGLNGSSRRG
ncbi:NAD(P)H quinone reductase LpdA [Mycobacterium tuberculosis str. Erdman = ATCC 35801]|nr:NAD(P)H quinone reductase LpdA [Mycobacterium tuberculosis str. Erdman = ATCC 35801]